jgi:hypothetical protein
MITKYDGFQKGPEGVPGCHNYTIYDKTSPAHGASFCIESPEDAEPDEATILERVREKERAFREGRGR